MQWISCFSAYYVYSMSRKKAVGTDCALQKNCNALLIVFFLLKYSLKQCSVGVTQRRLCFSVYFMTTSCTIPHVLHLTFSPQCLRVIASQIFFTRAPQNRASLNSRWSSSCFSVLKIPCSSVIPSSGTTRANLNRSIEPFETSLWFIYLGLQLLFSAIHHNLSVNLSQANIFDFVFWPYYCFTD